jgi:hypothetical protein
MENPWDDKADVARLIPMPFSLFAAVNHLLNFSQPSNMLVFKEGHGKRPKVEEPA